MCSIIQNSQENICARVSFLLWSLFFHHFLALYDWNIFLSLLYRYLLFWVLHSMNDDILFIVCCDIKAVTLFKCIALCRISSGFFGNVFNIMILPFYVHKVCRKILHGFCLEILALFKSLNSLYWNGFIADRRVKKKIFCWMKKT